MAKSKYESNVEPNLYLVECWARDGLTDKQIAEKLRISLATFYDYRLQHTEFLGSLKKGKEVIDYEVENALLKRAKGYTYDETTQEPNDSGVLVVTKIVTKQVVPDTVAQIYWLNNRKPDKWRNKPKDESKADTSLMEALLAVVKGGDDK
jgi:hypothetical protein